MSWADFVQTKGLADPLCSLMNRLISSWSWETEVKTPRRRRLLVMMEKKPSTALSHEADVGVKWKTHLG